jgi:hypothetical protein
VRYPEHNRRVAAFTELKENQRLGDWSKVAADNGWSDDDPGQPHGETDIMSQWVMLAICAPLGLAALGMVGWNARRTLVADAERVHGPDGSKVSYDRITAIDKARWDRKGIAWITYQDETGQEDRFKIDDWVFRGAAEVLAEVERRTGLGGDSAP